jgi:hypothetical protein
MKIPHACNQHTPPCLLREAALTRLELLFTTFIAIHKLNHTDVTKPFENSELIGTLDEKLKSLPTFKYTHFQVGGEFPKDFGVKSGETVVPFWQE